MKKRHRFKLDVCFLLFMLINTNVKLADGCGSIGTADPGSHISTPLGGGTALGFAITGSKALCCGTLTTWRFYTLSAGTVTAMLWRKKTLPNYELVTTEDLTVAGTGLSTFTVSHEVEIDDIIGWHVPGVELIPSSATAGVGTQSQTLGTVSLNSEVAWSQSEDVVNTYAFGGVITANVDPTVTSDSVTISNTDISQSIHTIAVADTDTAVITDLTSVTLSGSTEFSVVTTGAGFAVSLNPPVDIESGSSLTAGTYELVIVAEDRCGGLGTGTVTVTVDNAAPVFSPNPLTTHHATPIPDDTTTATSLYSFSVTDTDTITCTADNTNFEIRYINPNFELWLKSVAVTALDHNDATSQVITISCTDGNTAITSVYTVDISDQIPVLSGLGGTSGPIGDLSAIGTSVHKFTVTDQDDIISCSVTSPAALFDINALTGAEGTQEFEIVTIAGLDYDVATSHTVDVSCTDNQNPVVTGSQTVDLSDDTPVMTGLPALSASQPDGVQVATQLGVFSVTDANDQADIACTIQTPNDVLFEIVAGTAPEQQVWTLAGVTFDAADVQYDLDIECVDDQAANVVSGTYTVPVEDRAPVFVGTFPPASADLSDDVVVETFLGTFTVSDVDATCSITNPTGSIYEIRTVAVPADATQPEFEIWVQNTVTEADIDFNDQAVPLTLTVECTDGVNTPITDTFDVNIVDADPVLTGLPGAVYNGLSDGTTVAELLDTFTVTDSDDPMTCEVDPTDTAAAASFEVLTGTVTGTETVFEIYVKDNPGLDTTVTPSYTLPIICSDGTTASIVTGTKTVNIINAPPTFVDMPFTYATDLSDGTIVDTQIHTFSVDDLSTNPTITCTNGVAAPYNNDFEFRGTSPTFEIWLLAANNLNFNVDASLALPITCTDGNTPITENVVINLFDEDPVWTDLPAAGPYQFLPDTTAAATSLYTFSVADSDDTITCEVDAGSADATHFEVRAGTPPAFEIWYKGSPPATLNFQTQDVHDLDIICTDGAAYTATEVYSVELENSPPTFANLPNADPRIAEDVTTKTVLYTITVTDNNEVECTLTDTPVSAGILPLVKSNVALPNTEFTVCAHNLNGFDFEGSSGSITVDVTCGDDTTTITDTLTINIDNAGPVITNTGGSRTLTEGVDIAQVLKTIDIQEFDKNDATCSMASNDGGPFTVNGKDIEISGVLDFETKASYTLVVDCTDTVFTVSDTYTVNVANTGPEITNLPLGGSIDESQSAELLLLGLILTEDATSCYQVAPEEAEFIVKFEPTTSLWSIYYVSEAVAGQPLNVDVKSSYDITVVCVDASGALGAEKIYSITVNDNAAPVFTNVFGNPVTKVTVDAKTIMANDPVFLVTGEDVINNENDAITYSLLGCTPSATCPFIMSPDGQITSTVDLYAHTENLYTLSLKIEDKYNQNETPMDLIIEITDINTPPVLTQLPLPDVFQFDENNAVGDVVHTILSYDPDTADVPVYSCVFADGGDILFECDSTTGEIKALSVIDYEAQDVLQYNVDVTVFDSYNYSSTERLTISLGDVNEEPTFTQTLYTLTKVDEGGPGETVGCIDKNTDINDEDTNDVHKLTMNCPTGDGVFVMQNDGCVKMTKEWDLDADAKRLGVDTISCTVEAVDQGMPYYTATTMIDLVINEEDDNKPYLDQTSYFMCATVGSQSGTLGTFNVDDNDVLTPHKTHTYTMSGSGPFTATNGVMSYGDVSNYAVGTTFESTLRVTDEAGNFDESPVTVVICEASTATSSSSSSSSSSSTSSSSSSDSMLFWLIPAILLGALMLGLLGFLLWRYCSGGRCGRCFTRSGPKAKTYTSRRAIKPVQGKRIQVTPPPKPAPPPPKPPPGNIQPCELPITHYYARDLGNIGNAYPI